MEHGNKGKGILFIILAALCFSAMTFFIKLSGDLPTMQKAFFRNAFACVIAFAVLLRTPEKFRMRQGSLPWLILRAALGTLGLVANFWAVDHMNIADANVLNKMSPFFAVLMSYFILKERASGVAWACVGLAFVGALFVVKPTAGIASLPAVVALIGGLGAGTAYAFVRKLSLQGERGPLIVFFFSVFSTAVCLPFMIADFQPMTWQQTLLLLATGMSAAGGQFCVTAAYSHAPAGEISVFDYTQVLFASVFGFAFLHERPDAWSIVGYVIIIGAAILRWFFTMRPPKEKTSS